MQNHQNKDSLSIHKNHPNGSNKPLTKKNKHKNGHNDFLDATNEFEEDEMDHFVPTDTNGLLSGLNKTQNTNISKQTSTDSEATTNGYNESQNLQIQILEPPSFPHHKEQPSPPSSGKYSNITSIHSMNPSIFSLVSEKHCM